MCNDYCFTGPNGLVLEDELRRRQPDLNIEHLAPEEPGETKGVVAVITATATLAPLLVPIIKEILKRVLPQRTISVEVEEKKGGATRYKISITES